jgi:gamma-glutamyltranspeptidase/glutathione hydrolase
MQITSSENYISRRSPVLSRRGMVASSQPLAGMIGLNVLERGGNAADAAVAMAAALNVTQPGSTGLGGDCFCLYYQGATKRVFALNGSGRSPAALSIYRLQQEGISTVLPPDHAYAVTVPGAPAAWADLSRRFGSLSLADQLAPAIELAETGFPVGPLTAKLWQEGAGLLGRRAHGAELLIRGRAPRAGEIFRNPGLAAALGTLAREGERAFYEGEIAARIAAAVAEAGGLLKPEDLAAHSSEWVEPLSIPYARGARVYECPPNSAGLAALLALNIAGRLEIGSYSEDDPHKLHLLIEAMRRAFADTGRAIADPEWAALPVADLLSASHAETCARKIQRAAAAGRRIPMTRAAGGPAGDDTVYFCVLDAERNGCSFINSNFIGFGSGIVPAGCGFTLQNRGHGFSLDSQHPNCAAPRKRPYHTIIPGLLTREADDELLAVFGVMGGMMQPQGHLQVVSALLDDGLDPQAALDRGRFQLPKGGPDGKLLLEDAVPGRVAAGLKQAGYDVAILTGSQRLTFGMGQVIWRDARGVLWGGSDPRSDGCALGLP